MRSQPAVFCFFFSFLSRLSGPELKQNGRFCIHCLSVETWGFSGSLRGSFLNPPESTGLLVYCLVPQVLCTSRKRDIKDKCALSWSSTPVWKGEDFICPGEKHERRKSKEEAPKIVLLWKMSSCDTWHKLKWKIHASSASFSPTNSVNLHYLPYCRRWNSTLICHSWSFAW